MGLSTLTEAENKPHDTVMPRWVMPPRSAGPALNSVNGTQARRLSGRKHCTCVKPGHPLLSQHKSRLIAGTHSLASRGRGAALSWKILVFTHRIIFREKQKETDYAGKRKTTYRQED